MTAVLRLTMSLLPMALTPAMAFLLSEGYVNMGGGCKDILLLLPWTLWVLLYGVISLGAWWRGLSPVRAAAWATGGATLALLLAWLVLPAAAPVLAPFRTQPR